MVLRYNHWLIRHQCFDPPPYNGSQPFHYQLQVSQSHPQGDWICVCQGRALWQCREWYGVSGLSLSLRCEAAGLRCICPICVVEVLVVVGWNCHLADCKEAHNNRPEPPSKGQSLPACFLFWRKEKTPWSFNGTEQQLVYPKENPNHLMFHSILQKNTGKTFFRILSGRKAKNPENEVLVQYFIHQAFTVICIYITTLMIQCWYLLVHTDAIFQCIHVRTFCSSIALGQEAVNHLQCTKWKSFIKGTNEHNMAIVLPFKVRCSFVIWMNANGSSC